MSRAGWEIRINIFLFLDRAAAAAHGYYDGWVGDRLYYTGHGQIDDQELRRGNPAVLRHEAEGRAIRVLRGAISTVTYLGEFALDRGEPLFWMEAPESGTGHTRGRSSCSGSRRWARLSARRKVELDLPAGITAEALDRAVAAADEPVVKFVPVEEQSVEEVVVSKTTESYRAERREERRE